MIVSMTGFGQSEVLRDDQKVTVELSSLNSRFFEAQIRLPRRLSILESKVKEQIHSKIKRGKVLCIVSWKIAGLDTPPLRINEVVAEMYVKLLRDLGNKYSLPGGATVADVAQLEGVLEPIDESDSLDSDALLLEEVVESALGQMVEMRRKEGERLADDMKPRLTKITDAVESIRGLCRNNYELHRQKLENRLKELVTEYPDAEERVSSEAAIVAEKCDVTEECVRIESHVKEFLSTMGRDEPVGKRLNFLLQELNREANTIGSKSMSVEISSLVIKLKVEIEKLREQVQNIE